MFRACLALLQSLMCGCNGLTSPLCLPCPLVCWTSDGVVPPCSAVAVGGVGAPEAGRLPDQLHVLPVRAH